MEVIVSFIFLVASELCLALNYGPYYDSNGYDDFDYGIGRIGGGSAIIQGPLGGTTYLQGFGGRGIGGYYGGPSGRIGGGVIRGAYYNPYLGVGAVGRIGGVVGRRGYRGRYPYGGGYRPYGRRYNPYSTFGGGGYGQFGGYATYGGGIGYGIGGYDDSFYGNDFGYDGYDNGYDGISGIGGYETYPYYGGGGVIAGGVVGGIGGPSGGAVGGIGGIAVGGGGAYYPKYQKHGTYNHLHVL